MAERNPLSGTVENIDPFAAPPPGHSLTQDNSRWAWGQAPKNADPDVALDEAIESLSKPKTKQEMLKLLMVGISVEVVVEGIDERSARHKRRDVRGVVLLHGLVQRERGGGGRKVAKTDAQHERNQRARAEAARGRRAPRLRASLHSRWNPPAAPRGHRPILACRLPAAPCEQQFLSPKRAATAPPISCVGRAPRSIFCVNGCGAPPLSLRTPVPPSFPPPFQHLGPRTPV